MRQRFGLPPKNVYCAAIIQKSPNTFLEKCNFIEKLWLMVSVTFNGEKFEKIFCAFRKKEVYINE